MGRALELTHLLVPQFPQQGNGAHPGHLTSYFGTIPSAKMLTLIPQSKYCWSLKGLHEDCCQPLFCVPSTSLKTLAFALAKDLTPLDFPSPDQTSPHLRPAPLPLLQTKLSGFCLLFPISPLPYPNFLRTWVIAQKNREPWG